MEDNRKGTWEDVTEECTVDLDEDEVGTVNVRHPGREIRLTLYGNSMKPWAAQGGADFLTEEHKDEANSYRVTANPESNGFKVEHFIPDPEPEWVDVTDDCEVETSSNQGGLCARVSHKGNALAFLGTKVSDWTSDRNGYRLIAWPATGGESGGIRIEKQND